MTNGQLPEEKNNETGKTSGGLDQNVAGLLTYLGAAITGIIFLVIEKENRFVRFHAMQSIFVTVGLFIVSFVLGLIPILGWFLLLFIGPLTLVLWIVLMVQAYQGKYFKLPWIGDMAEKQVDNMK